ncbi:MAG: pyridoxamine 5'-phosphate oxidase family protein, partial [Gammaproteobacteria bacterium]
MARPQSSPESGPFHAGERLVQIRAQVPVSIEAVARQAIRDFMPDQHREFFAQLPFVLLGMADAQGQPWATILAKPPGFMRCPEPQRMIVHALPVAPDPISTSLTIGAPVGLLGIEPQSRRRNRMNGRVTAVTEHWFEITVVQSFGNCPKYIQAREARFVTDAPGPGATAPAGATELDAAALQMVGAADTFFIATTHPAATVSAAQAEGVDVSHRGGKPGFV